MSWKRWTFPPRTADPGRQANGGRRALRRASSPDPTPLGLHRRPRLRARRPRGSRTTSSSTGRPSTPTTRRVGRPPSSSRSSARRPRRPASARRWGPGRKSTAGFDVALTELDDGYVVRTASAAGEALIESLGLALADPSARDAARRGRRRRPAGDGHAHRHDRRPRRARRSPRPPGLGGRRRAMPVVHELHAGLPDLLLHERRSRTPTSTGPRRPPSGRGTPASPTGSPRSPAASFRPQHARIAIASG